MPVPNPGWNVVYGEIPAATKWSQLGANDDALAAGTGISDGAIINRHLAANIVKMANMDFSTWPAFLASGSASQNIIGGAAAVPFIANTEVFDIAGNYNNASYIFTVPPGGAGVYEFFLFINGSNGTSSRLIPSIKVNAVFYNGTQQTDTFSSGFCHLKIALAVGDTVQPHVSANPANIPTNVGVANSRWSGARTS